MPSKHYFAIGGKKGTNQRIEGSFNILKNNCAITIIGRAMAYYCEISIFKNINKLKLRIYSPLLLRNLKNSGMRRTVSTSIYESSYFLIPIDNHVTLESLEVIDFIYDSPMSISSSL